jgi:predicted ATPase
MNINSFGPFLRGIELERHTVPSFDYYPFNLGVIKSLSKLEFHPKVTYIVGENGMGKSTLMESIAVSWGFNPEGGTKNFSFSTQSTHSNLHEFIRLVREHINPGMVSSFGQKVTIT